MVAVEAENRGGVFVEADAAVAPARACSPPRASRRASLAPFVGPGEMRALKREHLGLDELTDVLFFPIDGREPVLDGLPSAWRRHPLPAGGRGGVAPAACPWLSHLLGYEHGAAMEAREAAPGTRQTFGLDSFNFAFEDHPLPARSGHAERLKAAAAVLVAAIATVVDRFELIALLLSISFVLITEMVNTASRGLDRRRHDLVRPAGQARQGHRRRCGADRHGERGRRRLPRLLRPVGQPQLAPDRPLRDAPAELTPIAPVLMIITTAFKAYTGRGTAARRPAVRARRDRVRRLDGCSWRSSATWSNWFLVSSVTFIMARFRGTGGDRDRSAFALHRGRLRRHPRCARRACRLPGAGVSAWSSAVCRTMLRRAPMRRTRVPRGRRRPRARRASVHGRGTSRTPPTRSGSARSGAASGLQMAGLKPGDLEEIAITASACGGCRQWLAEWRLSSVTYRRGNGEVVTVTPSDPLPGLVRPVKSGIVAVAGRPNVGSRRRGMRPIWQGRDRLRTSRRRRRRGSSSGERRGPRLFWPTSPASSGLRTRSSSTCSAPSMSFEDVDGVARARRARPHRRRRLVHRQAGLRPRRARRDRAEQGRPPRKLAIAQQLENAARSRTSTRSIPSAPGPATA